MKAIATIVTKEVYWMTIRIIMLIAEVLTGCHWIRFIRFALIAIMSIYALDKRYYSPLRPIS